MVVVVDKRPILEHPMRRYTRGEFLSLSAMLAGAVGLTKVPFGKLKAQPPTPLPQRGAGIEADLVVINARVLTMDPAQPRAEAFAAAVRGLSG